VANSNKNRNSSLQPNILRIATRNSPLALWQAHYIRDRLLNEHDGLAVEIVGMTTKGDKILDRSLSKVGGKGLFLKELEEALLDGRADIAVHSMKDVTVDLPKGLEISCVCERETPNDAFVSNRFKSLHEMPDGAVVGTSSLRRKAQLTHHFPQLQIRELRGNVNTRLKKMDDGEYDGIILAAAGLLRLGFDKRIATLIETEDSLPAVGQGIVGVECREGDQVVKELLAFLNDKESEICLKAERKMNECLDGGCSVPIAGFAELNGDTILMRGVVGDVENGHLLHATAQGLASHAESIGEQVAIDLLSQGAQALIAKAR
jgi:hydroxymethylbilane synthase